MATLHDLELSQQQEADGQWLVAAGSLQRYLGERPLDEAQLVRLARLYVRGAADQPQRDLAIEAIYRALGTADSKRDPALQRDLARLLLENERYPEAEAAAERLLQTMPQDAMALRVHALALLSQYQAGELSHKIPSHLPILARLERALAINPGDVQLAERTANAYSDLELVLPTGTLGTQVQRKEFAAACLDNAVRATPQQPAGYLARNRWKSASQIAGAVDDLQQALRWGSDDPQVVLTVADELQASGKLEHNAADSSRLLRQSHGLYRSLIADDKLPEDARPSLGLGGTLLALGEPDEAIEVLRRELVRFPESSADFHMLLADAYLASDDSAHFSQAEDSLAEIDRHLQAVAAETPESDQFTYRRDQQLRRGIWRRKRDDHALAVKHFQNALELQDQIGGASRQSHIAQRELGHALAAIGEWESAATALERAAWLDPKSADDWLAAAEAYMAAGRPDIAVKRATQAVRLRPDGRSYVALAGALLGEQEALSTLARNWYQFDKAITAARERAEDGASPLSDKVAILTSRREQLASAGPTTSSLTLDELHHDSWTGLPSTQRLLEKSANSSERPLIVNIEIQLLRSRSLSSRGEYEAAEEAMLTALAHASEVEREELYREIVQQRLARGDYDLARSLLTHLVQEQPENVALLRLAAEVQLIDDLHDRLNPVAILPE